MKNRLGIRNTIYFVLTASITILIDQVTKLLVVKYVEQGDPLTVIPGFFKITHSTNTGAAFGLFRGSSNIIFFVAICVLALLFVLFFKVWSRERRLFSISAGLMIGGAIGNQIDRLARGRVIDFLDFKWWAIFNVADIAILVGVLLFITVAIIDFKETGRIPGGKENAS